MTIPRKMGIKMGKKNKNITIKLIDTSRPSIPPSCVRSKRKYVPEEKSNDKLPADSSFSKFIIDDDL